MYIKCNKGKLLEEMNYDMWKLIYQQASLIKHEATVHGDKTFICKAFETLFGQKIHLRRHKVIYLQSIWKLTWTGTSFKESQRNCSRRFEEINSARKHI